MMSAYVCPEERLLAPPTRVVNASLCFMHGRWRTFVYDYHYLIGVIAVAHHERRCSAQLIIFVFILDY